MSRVDGGQDRWGMLGNGPDRRLVLYKASSLAEGIPRLFSSDFPSARWDSLHRVFLAYKLRISPLPVCEHLSSTTSKGCPYSFCVKCQSTFTAFSHVVFGLPPVNCHQWTRFFWPVTRSSARKGSLCLVSGSHGCGGVVSIHYVVCVCGTWCMHRIRVVFSVFSCFVIWWWEESLS